MNTENAKAKTFRLSDRLSVEITVGVGGLVCEWDPDLPERLTEEELTNYRKARSEMLAGLSEIIGLPITIVEG